MDKISDIVPVILCGGSGTRLWPVSRRDYPKQFTDLIGHRSLFQETLLRLQMCFSQKPIVITLESMKFLASHQINEIGVSAEIIAEPMARNSGPAVLLAAFQTLARGKNLGTAVFASDHVIRGSEAFLKAIHQAVPAAKKGHIVTFGIKPDCASPAYGYISAGHLIAETQAHYVSVFAEKPNIETAQHYLNQGYVWNSGNFVFMPDTLITEYNEYDSDTVAAVRDAFDHAQIDLDMVIPAKTYSHAESLSIDYAVMEKTDKSAVVTADFFWSDAGTWQSLYQLAKKDDKGNALMGETFLQDSTNCYVHNKTNMVVGMIGMHNTTIAVTEDAILITPTAQADNVQYLLNDLKDAGKSEAISPKKVFRPWGNYETIALGGRYQVKRITIYPSGILSLQKHFHRAEHWVIVCGTAEVTCDGKISLLTENQSVYIPTGSVHRLHNIGKINLELIEVQSGSYLGEDDIVRLEDAYHRV